MPDILTHPNGPIRTLTLNRPTKLNALTTPLLTTLLAEITAAESDPTCRVVILTGAGRGFCAGQELGPDVTPTPEGPADLQHLAHTYHHEVVRRMRSSRLPFICAVNGVAAGAGASFALAGDITLAARSARFVQAFIRIGLVPDSGATHFLAHRIGTARATALAMLGDAIDAETAERWGMIWKCVPDEALPREAEALATRLAQAPAAALAAIKTLFAHAPANTLSQQLDLEARLQGDAGRSPDFQEGMRAFHEKRPPRYS